MGALSVLAFTSIILDSLLHRFTVWHLVLIVAMLALLVSGSVGWAAAVWGLVLVYALMR